MHRETRPKLKLFFTNGAGAKMHESLESQEKSRPCLPRHGGRRHHCGMGAKLAMRIIDAVASISFERRKEFLSSGGPHAFTKEALEALLKEDDTAQTKFLSQFQRGVFLEVLSMWDRYSNDGRISEYDLARVCTREQYVHYLKEQRLSAFDTISGLTVKVLDSISDHTIIQRDKISILMHHLRKQAAETSKTYQSLEALLNVFNHISLDGWTITPGALFAYARKFDLEYLLLAADELAEALEYDFTPPAKAAQTKAAEAEAPVFKPMFLLESSEVRHG